MAFIDNLAFEMVTLVLAATTIAYTAFMGLVQYRRRGSEGLRSALRGSAPPIGFLGGVALAMGFWNDTTWTLPGAYNILFGDAYLLFGITLVAFAASVLLNTKLQFFGMFSLVAGGAMLEYGYQAYLLHLTKEPLEMFLLYAAFGLTAMLAFPATLVADRLIAGPVPAPASVASEAPVANRALSRLGIRATQPIASGVAGSAASETESVESSGTFTTRLPTYATVLVLALFVVSVGAAIAGMMFVGNTVPSHLASPP